MGRFGEENIDIGDDGLLTTPTDLLKLKPKKSKKASMTNKKAKNPVKKPVSVKENNPSINTEVTEENILQNQSVSDNSSSETRSLLSSDNIKPLVPKGIDGGLVRFTDMPLDYKPRTYSFITNSMYMRKHTQMAIKAIQEETGQPAWVVMDALLQAYQAIVDNCTENSP